MKRLALLVAFLMCAGMASAQVVQFDPENGAIGFGAMLTGSEAWSFLPGSGRMRMEVA